MKKMVQLSLKRELGSAPVELYRYDEDVLLTVLDQASRMVTRVPAGEISCYLHTVLIEGIAYQVMRAEKRIIQ